jgi:hypothetical protein
VYAAAVVVEGLRLRVSSSSSSAWEVRKKPLQLSASEGGSDVGGSGGEGGGRGRRKPETKGERTGTCAHRAAQAAIRKCVPPGLVVNQRLPTNVCEEDARSSDSVLRVSVHARKERGDLSARRLEHVDVDVSIGR